MYSLIYVSRSITPFPPDLRAIMDSSVRNNAKLGVTGALYFLDGVYCQYVEGDRIILADLYRQLLSDPRHKKLKLIELRQITNRLFSKWSMALVTCNKQTRALFKSLQPLRTYDLYSINSTTASAIFEVLARSTNWLELPPITQGSDHAPTSAILKAA